MTAEQREHIARVLVGRSLSDGGVTVDADGTVIDAPNGYAVGGAVTGIVVAHWRAKSLGAVVKQTAHWLRQHVAAYYGAWESAGQLYLDGTDIVPSLDAALSLCRQRGELAVYDFARQRDVECVA